MNISNDFFHLFHVSHFFLCGGNVGEIIVPWRAENSVKSHEKGARESNAHFHFLLF